MPEELTESVVQPKVPETKDIRSGIRLSIVGAEGGGGGFGCKLVSNSFGFSVVHVYIGGGRWGPERVTFLLASPPAGVVTEALDRVPAT